MLAHWDTNQTRVKSKPLSPKPNEENVSLNQEVTMCTMVCFANSLSLLWHSPSLFFIYMPICIHTFSTLPARWQWPLWPFLRSFSFANEMTYILSSTQWCECMYTLFVENACVSLDLWFGITITIALVKSFFLPLFKDAMKLLNVVHWPNGSILFCDHLLWHSLAWGDGLSHLAKYHIKDPTYYIPSPKSHFLTFYTC